MNTTSLAGHVVELHAAVQKSSQPADGIVGQFLRDRHYLGSKDRRFISEKVFGMIRHHLLIASRIRSAGRTPGISLPFSSLTMYCAYALGVEQLPVAELEGSVAPLWETFHRDTSLHETLQALSAADPFEGVTSTVQRLAITHSMPEFAVAEWVDRFGEADTDALCAALNQPAPITARVNTLRASVDECLRSLESEGVPSKRTRLSPAGIVFDKRINAKALRAYRLGWFEMQDEGSQLVGLLVDAQPGQAVIDACAGGGGKSLHLAAQMQNRGSLLAIDISARRLGDIRERRERSGASIIEPLLAGDGLATGRAKGADAVLVDAPCTGTGTFRRNPGAKLRITAEQRDALARTQLSLLTRNAALVRDGGRLVYSTCSLLRAENQEVVGKFLAEHPEFKIVSASTILSRHGISMDGDYLVLYPHRHGTDGFFAAVFERLPAEDQKLEIIDQK